METYSAGTTNSRRASGRLALLAISLCLISAHAFAEDHGPRPDPKLSKIKHIVVIYQENWSFDSLYGKFPGANGLANSSPASLNQTDRFDQPFVTGATFPLVSGPLVLTTPPQPINAGKIDTRFTAGLNTLLPYDVLDPANSTLLPNDTTGDLVHRYWQEQSQIDGGAMDWFPAWSDNPGLTMSYFDATNMPEGLLAQKYTMADNYFHSAFGGSFLNHQFLISAAAPVYPNAPVALQATLDTDGQLLVDPMTGKLVHDGNVTPIGGQSFTVPGKFIDNTYAVNTIFSTNLVPVFSAVNSSLLPSLNDSNPKDTTRPYHPTIGDRLSAAKVSWKWYSGGWDNALASTVSNPANNGVVPAGAPVDPLFQWHHQPFAFYDNYAPWVNGARNPVSAAHLQDENNFFSDLKKERLPSVVFIKALGPDNEHPGYAGLLQGQQHVADLVNAVKHSDYWEDTLIVVTYDEHGGRWDHVSPPVTGIWGDGSRVPAIIIGPLAKSHYVDHTQYDTSSILKTIEDRFGLRPLTSLDANARSLKNALR
jgi:phospholipase C